MSYRKYKSRFKLPSRKVSTNPKSLYTLFLANRRENKVNRFALGRIYFAHTINGSFFDIIRGQKFSAKSPDKSLCGFEKRLKRYNADDFGKIIPAGLLFYFIFLTNIKYITVRETSRENFFFPPLSKL